MFEIADEFELKFRVFDCVDTAFDIIAFGEEIAAEFDIAELDVEAFGIELLDEMSALFSAVIAASSLTKGPPLSGCSETCETSRLSERSTRRRKGTKDTKAGKNE